MSPDMARWGLSFGVHGGAMGDGDYSHWVTLDGSETCVPWRRIAELVLRAKLAPLDENASEQEAFESGFRSEAARMDVEEAVRRAINAGELTLLGPDSRLPLAHPVPWPESAVVSRADLGKFLARLGIGVSYDGVPPDIASWLRTAQSNQRAGRPLDYLSTLVVHEGETVFPLGLVATITAQAVLRGEQGPAHAFQMDVLEALHVEKLHAAVLARVVVPYVDGLLEPAPCRWDTAPEAGLVLPLGELRRFADLLLIRVEVQSGPGLSTVASQASDADKAAQSVTSTGRRVHRLPTRRDELTPAIDQAVKVAGGLTDPVAVWNVFVALAESKTPPEPLISARDGEVTYRTARGPAGISKRAFLKRIERRAVKAAGG